MDEPRTAPRRMSQDEFLDWAGRQEGSYELVRGEIIMQAGATRGHERVAKRVFALLYAAVDESRFDVNKGDFGVRIRPGRGAGSILYPDVVIDPQSEKGDERATETPIVIIEVLSPSTGYAHHVEKFKSYRGLVSLRHYVVLDQSDPKAWIWERSDKGWPDEPNPIAGIGGKVALACVEATLSLDAIYRLPWS